MCSCLGSTWATRYRDSDAIKAQRVWGATSDLNVIFHRRKDSGPREEAAVGSYPEDLIMKHPTHNHTVEPSENRKSKTSRKLQHKKDDNGMLCWDKTWQMKVGSRVYLHLRNQATASWTNVKEMQNVRLLHSSPCETLLCLKNQHLLSLSS